MNFQDIVQKLSSEETIRANSFDLLSQICDAYNESIDLDQNNNNSPKINEIILRALEKIDCFGDDKVILYDLVREAGLFPYLNEDKLSLKQEIAYEYHKPSNMDDGKMVFHREQAKVYRLLKNGTNVILSAPTSFGKSLIIDAIIASGKFINIVIILPTLALIDETRRRLSDRFGNEFKIITHLSQKSESKNIYVLTQERFLEVEISDPVDFFVIDEFYKLSKTCTEPNERCLLLNQAFYKLKNTGAQFYLLGPNIESLSAELIGKKGYNNFNFEFMSTDYQTVVSEVDYAFKRFKGLKKAELKIAKNKELFKIIQEVEGQTLIYCASPDKVREVASLLSDACKRTTTSEIADAITWISEEYHSDWTFVKALQSGIGMHHGQLPRALSGFVIKAFNKGNLDVLICTSTLIEGVNTSAKNVIIYDNKVAAKKYDYFTFNNISGRAGRSFIHFIGRVFVLEPPPINDLPCVDIPIVSLKDDEDISLMIAVDDKSLSEIARSRIDVLMKDSPLSLETIKKDITVSPEKQIKLARELDNKALEYWELLKWDNEPRYEQLNFVCKIIWDYLADKGNRHKIASSNQLCKKINDLHHSAGIKVFIKKELSNPYYLKKEISVNEIIERNLAFLRVWANYAFPKFLMALDRIQKEIFTKRGLVPGDYSAFATRVENYFMPHPLAILEEYGIPIQTVYKIHKQLRPEGSVDKAIDNLRKIPRKELGLSIFENNLIDDALNQIKPTTRKKQ